MSEYEKLDSKWIDEHEQHITGLGIGKNSMGQYRNARVVPVYDLQNLLVPKQELPVIPKFVAEWIEMNRDVYENIFLIGYNICNNDIQPDVDDWIMDNEEKFVRAWLYGYEVEKEEKYYVVKSEGLDGVHYYFTKFDDEMNGLFTLPNDTKGAYRFDDKEKAQAIANYTDGKVEVMEE